MDYFSRKPDFPTFEDIYIARAQGAIGLERREDGLACRFGQDGPVITLTQDASQGDSVRGRAVCDGTPPISAAPGDASPMRPWPPGRRHGA